MMYGICNHVQATVIIHLAPDESIFLTYCDTELLVEFTSLCRLFMSYLLLVLFLQNMTHFFCHLVFQTQPRMKGNAEIDRRNIFYRIENCSSMFPRKRILLRMCSYLFTIVLLVQMATIYHHLIPYAIQ